MASAQPIVEVDFDDTQPPLKPLHGVNLGPVDRGWNRDHSDAFRRAGIPSVRLHDASIMIADVVDLHCLFPDPRAEPDDPANYRFELTDDYLSSIRDAGAGIHFRLGESIEGRKRPRRLYVPLTGWTPERLARVSVNIVRHYNDGWANGHHWAIREWNFWNEPDNGAGAYPVDQLPMWTRTVDEFYDFYRAVAHALKSYDPALSVGLASFGNPYFAMPPEKVPSRMPHGWVDIIARCAREDVPFDFVSWNDYPERWHELVDMATQVRHYLDNLGRREVASFLTEWNYLPRLHDADGEYSYMGARAGDNPDRHDASLAAMTGVGGAAFVFGALAALQDAPLDAAYFYTGLTEPWGLFQANGRPGMKWAAFELFGELHRLRAPRARVRSDRSHELVGLAAAGGADPAATVALAYLPDGRPAKCLQVSLSGSADWSHATVRRFGETGWIRDHDVLISADGALTIEKPLTGLVDLTLSR